MPLNQTFLTVEELAAAFSCHSSSIYRMAKAGKIPGFRIGSNWRFDAAAIADWERERTINLPNSVLTYNSGAPRGHRGGRYTL